MKKIYLFSLMALSAAAVSAQVTLAESPEQFELKSASLKSELAVPSVYNLSSEAVQPVVKNAPKAGSYGVSVGGHFFSGMDSELRFYGASIGVGPAGRNAALYVYDTIPEGVTATYNWKIVGTNGAEQVLETSDNGKVAYVNTWGMVPYPVVSGTASDGATMGYDRSNDPTNNSKGQTYFSAQWNRNYSVSNADPGFYGGQLYGGLSETMYFGSGMMSNDGKMLEGVIALHNPQPTPMIVYGGTVAVAKCDDSKDIMPADAKLNIEIWSMGTDEEGRLVKLDKLGETECGSDNLQAAANGLYGLNFTFQQPNDLGLYDATPVIIPTGTEFGVFVNNLDEVNMRVLFALPETDIVLQGSAHILYEGDIISAITWTATNRVVADLCISLDCDMPSLEWDAERMDFPTEGGVGTTVGNFVDQEGNPIEQDIEWAFLLTSMPYLVNPDMGDMSAKNFTFEAPEWVKNIQIAEYKEGDYGWDDMHMYAVTAEADPLPEGETGRSGILMCTGPCGLKYGIKIGQGEWNPEEIEGGVESVAAPKAAVAVAGDNLMLTYGEEYNTVTVYNVAGSEVASYALPQGGSFEVPAADLNGVYMVVFDGASREVVKVVK